MSAAEITRQLRIGGSGIGYAGYFQIASWLSHHLTAEHDDLVCWMDYHRTATWFRKGVELLQSGGSDISLINMRGLCAMAQRGTGLIAKPFPGLRGLATFPHPDWHVFAVDPSFGVGTFAELKKRKCPLTLTTGYLDGDNVVGFLALELLRRHGIEPADIEAWGGEIFGGGMVETRTQLDTGEADAIFQEATGHDHWLEVFHRRKMVCLPMEPQVIEGLRRDYGWEPIAIPANTYTNQPEPLLAPDASAWMLCARDDLPEDVAYAVARLTVDHGAEIAQGKVPGVRGVTLSPPLPPAVGTDVADTTPLPLHPGAARLYRERGLI